MRVLTRFRKCGHRVQFYDSDAFLLQRVREFAEPAWRGGEGVLIIARRDHLDALRAMGACGACPATDDEASDCMCVDARELLARVMTGDMPDAQRLEDAVGSLLRAVSHNGARRVSAFDEMAAALFGLGNGVGALRLEQLWDGLTQRYPLDVLCAYPMNAFVDGGSSEPFQRICAVHSHVNPIECLHGAHALDDWNRVTARLQQRAAEFEHEFERQRKLEDVIASQKARLAAMASALAELEKRAGEDAVTGLSNRRIFDDRLSHAVERATRSSKPLALIFIDIDRFKAFNDAHGHMAGDHLLQQAASRLKLCVRVADTVCRWGGDEFAVIAEDADARQAQLLVQRIGLAMARPYEVRGAAVSVSASVGLGLFPTDARDVPSLVHSADMAMYRAKQSRTAATCEGPAQAVQAEARQGQCAQMRR